MNGTGGSGGERSGGEDKSQSRLGTAPFKEKLSEIRYFLIDLFHSSQSWSLFWNFYSSILVYCLFGMCSSIPLT